MSSVSIQPNSGGAGVFTIASPSSSTNYTLNLPAENGTILTTGSSVNLSSKIQPISASATSGALTVTLNPTVLDFRSSTTSSGTVNTRTIGTAISVTIPNGATLGTISSNASTIMALAIDNAGTIELAVVNLAGGVNLSETGLISTTAINTSSPALNSSNNVIYSDTARTSVPYRVVGFVQSTQTTAGVWVIPAATGTTTVQGIGGQAMAGMNTLGYGQTWQSVTRVVATTYYNLTGKPIVVAPLFNVPSNGSAAIIVNGLQVAYLSEGSVAGNNAQFNAIVPPGSSYTFTVSGATLTSCVELR